MKRGHQVNDYHGPYDLLQQNTIGRVAYRQKNYSSQFSRLEIEDQSATEPASLSPCLPAPGTFLLCPHNS